ncbi:tumor necrosis factor receptor superfamily member 14-like isoform X1 [Osmerus mordax]|uniref:tumor necrosis factor receptor superfamily member 14-like isoform X1 n=2 Tax=Osmerus mordax TaxID=8014 RepID=UPI00350FEED0
MNRSVSYALYVYFSGSMENHFHFQILFLFLHTGLCTGCGPAEYLRGDKCCPMCPSGNRVHEHCTEFRTTSCIPCAGPTYLDQPNGHSSCFPCTTCDPGTGMKVKQSCTPTSDAVCEPLQGYFCKLPSNQGCKVAQEHSRCKPGQYISRQATSFKDTECSDCTGDTFSTGSWTFCKPHTKCESLDMVLLSPGNHSSDTTCETLKSGVIVNVIAAVLFGVIFGVTMGVYHRLIETYIYGSIRMIIIKLIITLLTACIIGYIVGAFINLIVEANVVNFGIICGVGCFVKRYIW